MTQKLITVLETSQKRVGIVPSDIKNGRKRNKFILEFKALARN